VGEALKAAIDRSEQRTVTKNCDITLQQQAATHLCEIITAPKHCRLFLPSGSAIISRQATVWDSLLGLH